ncbi:MAG: ribosome-associated translation inhibitor RaiA [Planctomycetes bacterium]|nr:ribosome-associated translation inhibitor RaiA [Planctomycetota bacterium]
MPNHPMKIQIDGHHVKVTSAIQDHVHKKIDHLDKYFDGIHNLHVILRVEDSTRHEAEIVCSVVRGQTLIGKATHDDMYIAIDGAVHKLREHLKKYKDKLRGNKRKSGKMARTAEAQAQTQADEFYDDEDDGE